METLDLAYSANSELLIRWYWPISKWGLEHGHMSLHIGTSITSFQKLATSALSYGSSQTSRTMAVI